MVQNHLRFQDKVDKLTASQSIKELSEIIRYLCNTYGLANGVYHALYIPGSGTFNPVLILTYDPEWIRRYINNDYFQIDPVVSSGKRGFLPLDWCTVDRESNKALSFFEEADATVARLAIGTSESRSLYLQRVADSPRRIQMPQPPRNSCSLAKIRFIAPLASDLAARPFNMARSNETAKYPT